MRRMYSHQNYFPTNVVIYWHQRCVNTATISIEKVGKRCEYILQNNLSNAICCIHMSANTNPACIHTKHDFSCMHWFCARGYSLKGCVSAFSATSKVPFLELVVRTLPRTLPPSKVHCKTPCENPSYNLPRTLENILRQWPGYSSTILTELFNRHIPQNLKSVTVNRHPQKSLCF